MYVSDSSDTRHYTSVYLQITEVHYISLRSYYYNATKAVNNDCFLNFMNFLSERLPELVQQTARERHLLSYFTGHIDSVI